MILDTEQLIVDRLTEQLRGVAKVFTADELSSIAEKQQVTPAVHVVYGGYSPTREVGNGAIQEVETRWTLVVAVRTARSHSNMEKASPIIDAVISAVAGWKPGNQRAHLKLSAAPAAAHTPGFSYYPIQFTTKETVRGE